MTTMTTPPANRVVAALTPLVFAPLAGAISVAAAQYAPGMNVDENSITAIFIAGATIAFGKAAQWTKGWQQQERAALAPAPSADAVDDEDDDVDLPAPIDGEEGDDLDDLTAAEIAAAHDEDPDLHGELDELGDDEDHELLALLSAPEE